MIRTEADRLDDVDEDPRWPVLLATTSVVAAATSAVPTDRPESDPPAEPVDDLLLDRTLEVIDEADTLAGGGGAPGERPEGWAAVDEAIGAAVEGGADERVLADHLAVRAAHLAAPDE